MDKLRTTSFRKLWKSMREKFDISRDQKAILDCPELVEVCRRIGYSVWGRNRACELEPDDLAQEAWMGAKRAVESYNESASRHRKWTSWVYIKAEYAAKEAVRNCTFVHRFKVQEYLERGLAVVALNNLRWEEARTETGTKRPTVVAMDTKSGVELRQQEAMEEIVAMLKRIGTDTRERDIFLAYATGQAKQNEIAALHGLNYSRVSQIYRSVVERMMDAIEAQSSEPTPPRKTWREQITYACSLGSF